MLPNLQGIVHKRKGIARQSDKMDVEISTGYKFMRNAAWFVFHIHQFHIVHNAPCLLAKILHAIIFDFSWDDCNNQEKLETMVMQKSGG